MRFSYFLLLSIVCFISCQTFVKDEPEIEKVVEDATKEIIEDMIENG